MKRAFLFAIALAYHAGAQAQQGVQLQLGVPPALEVQRIAPQLVAFAGGEINFANLVNGLALGLPVTLTTPIGPGVTQVVSFTPLGTLSALQIAQTLETARQSLISRGIATPTAQQIGITLAGGALPTAVGTTPVTALIATSTSLGSTLATPPSPAATLQPGAAAAGGTTVRNTSDSPFTRPLSDTPQTPVPGVTTGTSGAAASGTPPPAPMVTPPATATTPAAPAPWGAR